MTKMEEAPKQETFQDEVDSHGNKQRNSNNNNINNNNNNNSSFDDSHRHDFDDGSSNNSGLLNRQMSSTSGSASGGAGGLSSSGDSAARSGGSTTTTAAFHNIRDVMGDAFTSKNICSLRILVLLLFITMSIYIPILIFKTTSETELESFQREYDDLASKIINSFDFRMAQQLQAMDSIDISITSYASAAAAAAARRNNGEEEVEVYPQVTLPDFDLTAANTLALAGTAAIWLVPVVQDDYENASTTSTTSTGQLRQDWEDYAVENQDWISTAVNRELPRSTAVHRGLLSKSMMTMTTTTTTEDFEDHYETDDNEIDSKRKNRSRRRRTKETLNHRIRRKYGKQFRRNRRQRRHLTETDNNNNNNNNDPFDQELDGIATSISQFGRTTTDSTTTTTTTLVPVPLGTGPYFPIWQNAPAVEDVVNINLFSMNTFQASLTATMESQLAVLGNVVEFTDDEVLFKKYMDEIVETLNSNSNESDDDLVKTSDGRAEPISMMMYPIFDKFDDDDDYDDEANGQPKKMVGLFAMTVFWHVFFEGVLPSNAEGLICVIENACDQAFTYRINGGSTVLEGYGDVHDGSFEDLAKDFEINANVQASKSTIPLNVDFCPYTLTVYPSPELESEFLTYRPALYTSVVALAFAMIFAVAVTYDCVVQRRLMAALNTALESRAIISSLFPENVRDRLFVEQQNKNGSNSNLNDPNNQNPFQKNGHDSSNRNSNKKEILFGDPANDQNALHPAKLRLKSFLNETPAGGGGTASTSNNSNADMTILQSKPIADLFPNCTVLFADIAGFTAWSSEREPAQVFTLLQTIFHYFDNIAKKWGVFKVETIGDCYVAVTGLPDPQHDHAVRMAKFARESLRTVSGLTHKLETSLGPDTGDLMMRFGMHSGPVTAGVLRGEKSRFQLFGDTVNLASRMENTGKKGYIQISPTTADLLEEAGKSAWLTPREELVTAKGKGRIQTYWVAQSNKREGGATAAEGGTDTATNGEKANATGSNNVSSGNSQEPGSSTATGDGHDRDSKEPAVNVARRFLENQSVSQNRKLQRLVDWQTEILARLLRAIVAKRGKKDAAKFVSDPTAVLAQTQGDCVLDEVAEILRLPDFDEKRTKNQISPNTVELSPAVMTQLRDYVLIICSKYKNNPFHNFEHASHVTMSSSKLLSRIVVPENVDYQQNNKKDIASDLHDFTYGITSDPLTQFASIFCSLIHDVDHRGVSNFQLGTEQPDMNTKYKNRSLAEQNSVDIAWDLLMQPEFRNLQQCIFTTEKELQRFRQLVVNLVMATDIFDSQFKDLRNSRWQRAFHHDNDENDTEAVVSNEDRFDMRSTIVIEHIIQAADVAHTMQHWHVYTKWNERLFNEMYLAYENGRSPKDPSEGWYKGELWFFDNYVIPLGKKLDECNVFGVASDEGLNYALANRAEWAIKGEEIVQDMVRRYQQNKKPEETPSKSS